MARQVKQLSATQVSKAKPQDKEYNLPDGRGLMLRVKTNGSKLWLFNYTHPITKKRKNVSLGQFPALSLEKARKKAEEMRSTLADGLDPKQQRDQELAEKQLSLKTTLRRVAEEWLEKKKDEVTDDYAKDIWRSLELHIFPKLGDVPIDAISPQIAIDIIQPVADKGALETVRRLCQRLNDIMTYAVHTGKIEFHMLANIKERFKKPKVAHMKTMRPEQLPYIFETMSKMNMNVVTRYAFEFQLHTLSRPNECAKAEWSEIDFENATWTIPAEKMKRKREHIVLLSNASLAILRDMQKLSRGKQYVFPGSKNPDTHMNSQSVNAALKRAGLSGKIVSHGLRSIGSTALNEQMFNKDVIELCLSHVDKNSIRDTYNNAQYFDERRNIMAWWSDYILAAKKASM